MTFDEILDQVLEMLQRRSRVSYRALKRQFDLDDAYLADLKAEIIDVHQLAVDQDGTMLVWIGGSAMAPSLDQTQRSVSSTLPPPRPPLAPGTSQTIAPQDQPDDQLAPVAPPVAAPRGPGSTLCQAHVRLQLPALRPLRPPRSQPGGLGRRQPDLVADAL